MFPVQRLCLTFCCQRRGVWASVAEHGVEDAQQLAHAGDQSEFEGLSGLAQMLEVTAYLLVETSGSQGRHIQSGAHRRTASPDLPFSLLQSAITVERRDSHQRTDLFAIERSQLGQ